MAGGNWNYNYGEEPGQSPAHLDPWSKMELNFIKPIEVSSSGSYTVYSAGTGKYNILKVLTSNSNQYFLVENRELDGFDSGAEYYCNNGGIAIWHIDNSVIKSKYEDNSINDDEYHKGIDLEEANAGRLGYCQLDRSDLRVTYKTYDNFYYSSNNTEFGDSTDPNSDFYNGTSTKVNISTLSTSSSAMTVKVGISGSTENPISVSGITLNKDTLQLSVTSKETLTATITPENAADKKIIWTSSDKSVATVDSNGVVRGVKKGITTITAATNEKINGAALTDSCIVFVTTDGSYIEATGIKLDKETMILSYYSNTNKGQKGTLTAVVAPANSTFTAVKWSSSNEKVATVDSKGNVMAKGAGQAVITATTVEGGLTAVCTVKVTDNPVKSISLDNTKLSMLVSQKKTLKATINPSNADYTDVVWTSSNPSIAKVDSEGKVTAIAKGSATITATSVNEGKKAACKVNVALGIEFNKKSSTLKIGSSTVLKVKVDKTLSNKTITWRSSDDSVVSVADNGNITALRAGTATITATITADEGGTVVTYESQCAVTTK